MTVNTGGAPSLTNAVESLQQFFQQETLGEESASVVRQKATAAQFPYPELAVQVYKFLQQKRVTFNKGLSLEDIEDAFLTLLMDSDAVASLGAGRRKNPWQAVRAALRNTGQLVGKGLLDLYESVRQNGMGYVPTMLELSKEMEGLMAAFMQFEEEGPVALKKFAEKRGAESWKIALLMLWWKRKNKGLGPNAAITELPEDTDFEDIFWDENIVEELMQEVPDGPWEVYQAQGQALRTLRSFGESLVELHEASS